MKLQKTTAREPIPAGVFPARCYKIIHFATHSLIDDSSPERSTIILSLDNDPKEDGFLQVREI